MLHPALQIDIRRERAVTERVADCSHHPEINVGANPGHNSLKEPVNALLVGEKAGSDEKQIGLHSRIDFRLYFFFGDGLEGDGLYEIGLHAVNTLQFGVIALVEEQTGCGETC